MSLLYSVFADPFVQMAGAPDLLLQTVWEGLVAGVLYALTALGFVLIYKASGVFNFAQGIMVVFAALTLVGLTERGVPAPLALLLAIGVMLVLALCIERVVLRPLVNQPDIVLFMATFGLTWFLIGFGELVFGGEPKAMPAAALGLPTGSVEFRALRAVADSHKAALSVGISLNQIWAIVWFAAGVVALVAGIMWGARSNVSFALQIVALKALPVLILGGFTSIPGVIVAGLGIGIVEKLGEFYWGPLFGSGIESWLAYVLVLLFLLARPQGLFGDKLIERI